MPKAANPIDDGPELTPEVKAARAKFLEHVADFTLQDAIITLNNMLEKLEDRTQRLGNLAAQTWIVRKRIQAVISGREETVRQSLLLKAAGAEQPTAKISAAQAKEMLKKKMKLRGSEEKPKPEETEDWVRIRMIKEAEVNGMVFFENSVLQVKRVDAQSLLDEKIAEVVNAEDVAPTPDAPIETPDAPDADEPQADDQTASNEETVDQDAEKTVVN